MKSVVSALREELRAVLMANTATVCGKLTAEIEKPLGLEAGTPLTFEVDPFTWGVGCCATGEAITETEGDWLAEGLTWEWFERAEGCGANADVLIEELFYS